MGHRGSADGQSTGGMVCLELLHELQEEIRASVCVSWDLNGRKGQQKASHTISGHRWAYHLFHTRFKTPPDLRMNPRLFQDGKQTRTHSDTFITNTDTV